jgi:hypothetical protein
VNLTQISQQLGEPIDQHDNLTGAFDKRLDLAPTRVDDLLPILQFNSSKIERCHSICERTIVVRQLFGQPDECRCPSTDVGVLTSNPLHVLRCERNDQIRRMDLCVSYLMTPVVRPRQSDIVERRPSPKADRHSIDRQRAPSFDVQIWPLLRERNTTHHRPGRVARTEKQN